MKPSAFRGNDIRGIYKDEIDEQLALRVGYVAPDILGATRVFVARDGRKGSEDLCNSLINGLLMAGVEVIEGGLMDTCQFYYSCFRGEFAAGFMITASHNPKEYNGIKIVRENAYPITLKDALGEIKDAVFALDSDPSVHIENPSLQVQRFTEEYISYIYSCNGEIDIKPLKIVVDASHGVGSALFAQVFGNLGLDMQLLNFNIDGDFPSHSPNPQNPETCIQLQEAVTSSGADLGIIFDGDADRVMFCDEKGEMLRGDVSLALLAKPFLKRSPGSKVLCDIRSSDFVRDIVEGHSGTLVEAPVGHGFIVQKMANEGIPFGGEVSGHLYYACGDFVADNAMLAVFDMLKLVSESDIKLSEMAAESQEYATIIEINFKGVDTHEVTARVREKLLPEAIEEQTIDGLSLRFMDWKMNLRGSNTEPLVRLMIEATNQELLEEKMRLVRTLIEK